MRGRRWSCVRVVCLVLSLLGPSLPMDVPTMAAELPSQALAADGAPLGHADPAPAEQARRLELIGQVGGGIQAVSMQGKYAYLGVGPRLVVLDVSDPARPVVRGQSAVLPDMVTGITMVGTYAYVANGRAGMRILDVAHPASPIEVISYGGIPGSVMQVEGHYAYAASQGLRILDVSDPLNPRQVSVITEGIDVQDLVVIGRYAYVAGATLGLSIVDVSGPTRPVRIGAYQPPSSYEFRKLTVAGAYAYLAMGRSGVRVVDVSDRAHPLDLGLHPLAGSANAVAIAGSRAYIAEEGEGLRIADVTDPRRPVALGLYSAPAATNVLVQGTLAYVVDEMSGLHIVDVSEPVSPRQVGFYAAPGRPLAVATSGTHAYVATSSGELRIVDVADPARLAQVGLYDGLGSVQGLAVSGGYVYAAIGQFVRQRGISVPGPDGCAAVAPELDGTEQAEGRGLRIVDVSDPIRPREAAFFAASGRISGVAVAGSIAYLAQLPVRGEQGIDAGGLRIIDISSPDSPREVAFLATAACPDRITVAGGYVYLSESTLRNGDRMTGGGLRIIDVSDPAHPVEAGRAPYDGIEAMTVAERYLHLANPRGGVVVLDVSDPAKPAAVGWYDQYGEPMDVAVVGSYAYVADYAGGLHVYDVSDPARPAEAAQYPTAHGGVAVKVLGERAHVLTRAGGLFVLRHTATPGPRTLQVRSFNIDVYATVDDTTVPLGRSIQLENMQIREGALPSGTVAFSGIAAGIPFTTSLTLAVVAFEPLTLIWQESSIDVQGGSGFRALCATGPIAGCPMATMTLPGTARFAVTVGGGGPGLGGASFTFAGEATISGE